MLVRIMYVPLFESNLVRVALSNYIFPRDSIILTKRGEASIVSIWAILMSLTLIGSP